MQVSVESTSGLGRRMKVVLPAQRFQDSYQARVRDTAKSANLRGFRPGKVPTNVIEQRFGAQLRGDVAMELVRESLALSMDQEKLRPAATPNVVIQSASPQDDFVFEATFDVYPEVGSIDVSTLDVVHETSAITDADVDQMIDNLKLQRRSWTEVERAAQAGDLVSFELSVTVAGKRIPAEGAERGATILGSGAVFADIETALTGTTAGHEASFTLNYPADFRDADVAGQAGAAQVKVLAVKEPSLPAVDADFVRSFGVASGDEAEFRREIRANLERELAAALSARLRSEVVNKLVAAHASFELPGMMVEAEAKALRSQAVENARRNGAQVPVEPPLDGFMEGAARRVRAGILLEELARQNDIKLDPARVSQAISAIASTYEDPAEVLALYRKDERLAASLRSRVMEEQVADWVAGKAQTTQREVSFAEILKARG